MIDRKIFDTILGAMSATAKFKVFCIEQYKVKHGLTGREAVTLFEQYGVFEYLTEFYDVLHSFGANYIVEDIELFIKARQN